MNNASEYANESTNEPGKTAKSTIARAATDDENTRRASKPDEHHGNAAQHEVQHSAAAVSPPGRIESSARTAPGYIGKNAARASVCS